MFGRYPETARRTVFFAHYGASQLGSPQMNTEHLLLNAFHEDKGLANRLSASHDKIQSLRNSIAGRVKTGPRFSTTVDLPLGEELKRALAHSANEGDRLRLKTIGTELLLLGLAPRPEL